MELLIQCIFLTYLVGFGALLCCVWFILSIHGEQRDKKKTPYCWICFIYFIINTHFLFITFGCIFSVSIAIWQLLGSLSMPRYAFKYDIFCLVWNSQNRHSMAYIEIYFQNLCYTSVKFSHKTMVDCSCSQFVHLLIQPCRLRKCGSDEYIVFSRVIFKILFVYIQSPANSSRIGQYIFKRSMSATSVLSIAIMENMGCPAAAFCSVLWGSYLYLFIIYYLY